MLAIGTVHHC